MSTRFYFSPRPANPTGNTITPSSGWEHATIGTIPSTGALVADPLDQAVAVSQSNAQTAVTTAVNPADVLLGQFVSDPLPAQTLSGTFSIVVQMMETTADDDGVLQVIIRVVSNDGLTVRGTAYAGVTTTTVSTTTTAANYELLTTGLTTRFLEGVSLTNTTVQAGDRIVVEVGARSNAAAGAVQFWANFFAREDCDDFELVPDRIQTPGPPFIRPWIEFSQDLFTQPAREEYRFGYTGVLLNGTSTLPFVDVEKVDGLDSAPVDAATNVREGAHGGLVSASFETHRTVTLEGTIYASPSALDAYLDSLKYNFRPNRRPHPLFFGSDASPIRMVYAKSLGIKFAKDSQRRLGVVPFQIQFLCPDPRIYLGPSPKLYTQAITASPGTTTTLTIGGTREVFPLIVIRGACTNMGLQFWNQWGTQSLLHTGVIAQTDVVIINPETHSIMLNWVTSIRSNWSVSDWPILLPGANTIQTQGTTLSGSPRVQLRYQEALA